MLKSRTRYLLQRASGKVCYVVRTDESDVAPHFLNGRKGIWARADEFSARFEAQLAHENELRHLLDRRRLVRERRITLLERARKRFDTYAAKGHTDRSGNRTNFGPRLELCVVPRFPSRPLCDQARLAPLITEQLFRWRDITSPVSGSSTISQHESTIVLGAAGPDSTVEANIWGMMFYSTRIADDHNPVHASGIHLYDFVGTTMLFMRRAETILRTLGYSGPLRVQMGLHGMRDAQWLHGSAGIYTKEGSELDDDVEFSILTTSHTLQENLAGVLKDILRYVFFSVNWPGLIDQQSKLDDLLRSGYKYNMWSLLEREQV